MRPPRLLTDTSLFHMPRFIYVVAVFLAFSMALVPSMKQFAQASREAAATTAVASQDLADENFEEPRVGRGITPLSASPQKAWKQAAAIETALIASESHFRDASLVSVNHRYEDSRSKKAPDERSYNL